MHVVYSQDSHQPGDREWTVWPEHCREGTWGWEIVAELQPRADDAVLRKTRYDVFHGTPLDDLLQRWGVDTLVICGTGANICVHYTAATAALRWYAVVIPRDAISALEPFDLEASLRQTTFVLSGHVTMASRIRTLPCEPPRTQPLVAEGADLVGSRAGGRTSLVPAGAA